MAQHTLYGFVTCAAFNVMNGDAHCSPNGDAYYYLTRKVRDRALKAARDWNIKRGLSPNAARSGIYPIKLVVRTSSRLDAEHLLRPAQYNETEYA
jgi:hypothetical protein